MGNCKMIRSHLSAQIQLFCGAAAVTIWVSSGCQMSCYAASFFAGKNKRGEEWVPKRSTHFMGGQMMPSSRETPAKFAYRWREFFPSDSFVFSRPLVCKRSLSILSSKVKDAPIRVYQMPENRWKVGFFVSIVKVRRVQKKSGVGILNELFDERSVYWVH